MTILYDNIGLTYDSTRQADTEITRRLRNHLQVSNQSKVLDVACGTGNYTVALENTGLQMSGMDVSKEMLNKARHKSTSIHWQEGDVKELPFESDHFDGVTCTLAIHHFNDLLPSFQEMFRVLNKGRLVIFTSSPEQMNQYWLNEYFPKAIADSAKQMPSLSLVNDRLEKAGFRIIGHEHF
ncbi:class I SAM-dependent methyltransferase [Alkalihalobacillus sp. LMS39]|uniref:class I SAM-dependent methyltransferase n=1 Tax=Alkalihalobacillus sp. LMS39 TaxID=2924032 RepID=UPI001FB4F68E|nr:class I SAM-dependent methyltransferase [Alkalihalobacillus sp. LMS39]UOE95241.1 class I SAM-dependent methyltransferase [Alkalihalobacillus sp. LMS39]